MSELDDRIRTALGTLAHDAAQQVRAPGAPAAATAARRRRLAGAGAALALLASGTATGAWALNDRPADRPGEVAACAPADAAAFLPIYGEDEAKERVRAVLDTAPEVRSMAFETREHAYERFKIEFRDDPDLVNATTADNISASWRFTIRCTTDFPPLKSRLLEIPVIDVVCLACEPWTTPTR
ncbi:permease-like cell division protein FtsX [Dactylosporangium sp. AC04546]|uniref:permease-like cell division protein FtsX n=1 Tax=Dactylosporangium sp. AC04546 TaxID=2862460 RepID=UPI001EDD63A8|nr:permease-like cell division protein FtsX [Dactylosporangium sp. AC04546]WVK78401.1 permease-like cell division protein FtsX [Dactylosporangium sp. AC04546]